MCIEITIPGEVMKDLLHPFDAKNIKNNLFNPDNLTTEDVIERLKPYAFSEENRKEETDLGPDPIEWL